MTIDRILARPSRDWYSRAIPVLPIAFLISALTPIVARQYTVPVLSVCLVVILAIIVRFTPYLLIACVCFFAVGQLEFPKIFALRAWGFHVMWLSLAAFCLWRVWRLWPLDLPKGSEVSISKVKPSAWPAILSILVVGVGTAIVAYMIYVFHFQE